MEIKSLIYAQMYLFAFNENVIISPVYIIYNPGDIMI